MKSSSSFLLLHGSIVCSICCCWLNSFQLSSFCKLHFHITYICTAASLKLELNRQSSREGGKMRFHRFRNPFFSPLTMNPESIVHVMLFEISSCDRSSSTFIICCVVIVINSTAYGIDVWRKGLVTHSQKRHGEDDMKFSNSTLLSVPTISLTHPPPGEYSP